MTTSTTYEQRLEAAKANPQQFAQDVMALVKQHPTYHDNIEWHIGDQYSCKTSHCWAGFGELLLHNASPEKPFSSQETRELIRDVLGLGKVTADHWFLSTWKIEDLEHFVKLFCDPIEEVIGSHANFKIRKGRYAEQALILASRPDLPIEWMEVLYYHIVLSRPDLTIPAAKLSIEKLHTPSSWMGGWAFDTIKSNLIALANTPELKDLLPQNYETSTCN